jgi:uncharacterized NAD(P)/FAD-binding protein YdhS
MPHILIIGGGFSGTMLAYHLVAQAQENLSVTLVERSDHGARGLAYSTPDKGHLLNVRANQMGVFAEDKAHFWRWVQTTHPELEGREHDFLSRRLYGEYLEHLLQQAMAVAAEKNISFLRMRGEITEITQTAQGLRAVRADGQVIQADRVVLATGNHGPKHILENRDGCEAYSADPFEALRDDRLLAHANLLLLGTGLTMVDVVSSLHRKGYQGKILALSRHGWLPQPHSDAPHPPATAITSQPLSHMLRALRGEDWRQKIDGLRAHTTAYWQAMDEATQRRFVRHAASLWSVHRHRMPPQSSQMLTELQSKGQLQLLAGRIQKSAFSQEGAEVRWQPRYQEPSKTMQVGHIVNCVGPEHDIRKNSSALFKQLQSTGAIIPHPYGGMRQASDGSVAGALEGRLYALGPLWVGEKLESIAVPELRVQAEQLAALFHNNINFVG